MTQRFNLLDEPWIRVTRLDGAPDEVSLLALFQEATDIAGIHGEIASQDVAILRLLLAICHRTMDGPEDLDTWREYWEEPESLGRDASAYLERYRERFDLRDPDRPFFQVANIQGKVSPVSKMIIDTPKDLKRPLFTTRIGDGLESLSWSEAARWLIHVHAFDPAGLRSGALGDPRRNPNGTTPPNGPGWAGQLGTTYVTSNSLLKTMLLNVVPASFLPASIVDAETDVAPWELTAPTSQCSETSSSPTGPVYCLTWQSRRVLLIGDDVHVTGLFLGNGTKTSPQNLQTVETMSSWRRSAAQEKKLLLPSVFMPVGHESDVAFWRSLPSLIPQLNDSDIIPPAIIVFYRELMRRRLVPRAGIIPVHAVGISYDPPDKKTNVVELIDDVLSLPAGLFNPENTRLLAVVHDAMEETEHVASALRNLAGNLDRARGGSPDTASAAREHASVAFYQVIDERFPRWLVSLDEAEPVSAHDLWRSLLRSEAWGQQEALASAVPDTAFAGRGEGKGRMDVGKALFFFRRALNVAVPAPAQQDSTAENNMNEERTPA